MNSFFTCIHNNLLKNNEKNAICIIIFFTAIPFFLIGQNPIDKKELCLDSVLHKKICHLVDSTIYEKYNRFNENSELFKIIHESEACKLKRYALCFDCFFKAGLKLEERLPERVRGARNSIMVGDSVRYAEMVKPLLELNKKVDEIERIHTRFLLYADVKRTYEYSILQSIPKEERQSFKNQIKGLVHFGAFDHPLSVYNTMIGKYKKITHDKRDKDMEYYKNK